MSAPRAAEDGREMPRHREAGDAGCGLRKGLLSGLVFRPTSFQKHIGPQDQVWSGSRAPCRSLISPLTVEVCCGAVCGCSKNRRSGLLRLVNAPAHRGVVETLTVHFFCFEVFRQRVWKLVVLPEAILLLRKLYALLDELLAVGVLRGDRIRTDQLLMRT